MADFSNPNDPLADAHKEFVAFYSAATAADAALKDELISAFTVLVVAIRQPRETHDPQHAELERLTHKTEQAFIAARDAVRACQTFLNLCDGDRRRIENVLFSPYQRWEN
jgi:hypothetical protein